MEEAELRIHGRQGTESPDRACTGEKRTEQMRNSGNLGRSPLSIQQTTDQGVPRGSRLPESGGRAMTRTTGAGGVTASTTKPKPSRVTGPWAEEAKEPCLCRVDDLALN